MTRLSVPYISQLVGGTGGNNCGPAALAMALAYRGVIAPTQEAMLEVADIARDGLSDDRGMTGGYTTLNQLADVAREYGQATWAPRNWDDVATSVGRQEPVIVLLNNRVLQPRQYPNTPAWDAFHFILVTSTPEGANRYSSDPLSYYVGGPSFYTEATTRQGVADTQGFNALALVPLEVPTGPEEVDEIMLMTDAQVRHWVLSDLYLWAGVAYNPESASAKGWVGALRDKTYLGRPRTEERPYGEPDDPEKGVWVEFDAGVLWVRTRDNAWSVTG